MFFDYKKGNNLYMVNNIEENYPNLTWSQFAVCNDDATDAFEYMARRLFPFEFLNKCPFIVALSYVKTMAFLNEKQLFQALLNPYKI